MSEIEKINEFIEHLTEAEEIIGESVNGLNYQCPIEVAKKRIVGVERNIRISRLDTTFLTENPYIKNIYIGDWQIGNVFLNSKDRYEAYKTRSCNSRERDKKTFTTIYNLFYFPQNIQYPSLGEVKLDSKCNFVNLKWMGVEPGEINTFSSFIEKAHGKVLLMGCGLGYVAYMLSLKDSVDEVTIIELNPYIKKMFEIYLKPQMNSKINIYEGDAIQFLENENISMYQYCNVDIWRDLDDMIPLYLKCLLLEDRHPETKFYYWLEEDLHVALEELWIALLRKFSNKKIQKNIPEMLTDILNSQNLETLENLKQFLLAPKRPLIKEWVVEHPKETYNYEGLSKSLERLFKK